MPTSMFHGQHGVTGPWQNTLDPIWSKQIYFGFIWHLNVLPVPIRLLFHILWQTLICSFVGNVFRLGCCRGCLRAVSFTLTDQSLKHQFPHIILVPSERQLLVCVLVSKWQTVSCVFRRRPLCLLLLLEKLTAATVLWLTFSSQLMFLNPLPSL